LHHLKSFLPPEKPVPYDISAVLDYGRVAGQVKPEGAGGFAQAGHGKRTGLARMPACDRIICYP
jgi:hypothetical protein